MATKTIQAVIFGATGLAGSGVLDECIKHPRVTRITVVSRKSTGKSHAKLNEIIHQNFLDYSSIENSLNKLFPSFITNTEEFGLAMINAALFGSTNKIFENRDIRKMAKIKDT
jgi:N-acetyl-gamma-glutamylphosphate reductase